RERRAAELAGDRAARRAAEATRARELALVAAADVTFVVSEAERALLAADAPGADARVLSNLHALPPPGPGRAGREGLLFVGGFRHPPNVDAVRWFAREVFPLARAALPGLAFHCIGGDLPAEVRELAGIDGVHVHGHVPDLGPWLDGCVVSVAPLRYGAGVKGKVNQAMAHGLPVVATTPAVEGMHLRDGEDVLVADAPRAFADALVRLHEDAALWRRLAEGGRANVRRHFSADAARDVVRQAILGRG
ncbi:MAG TPA: glycosyltransferase family 4 protein, partial [Thermomonas sp.]|nr:glycosyltransferase family 4 protein [Thermomonas sp.]